MGKFEKVVYKNVFNEDIDNFFGVGSNFGASITFVFTYKGQLVYSMPQKLVIDPCFTLAFVDSWVDDVVKVKRELPGEPSEFSFSVDSGYGLLRLHDFSEDEFLRDIWVKPSNLSLLKNEDLEKKVNLAFFSVYVSLRSLAMVSVIK